MCTWAATTFQCTECHRTRNHKIAGRSSSVPVSEGRLLLREVPFRQAPLRGRDLLDHHLNKHSDNYRLHHLPRAGLCQVQTHQDLFWDWSKAGDKKRKAKKDKYGMADYHWKKGEFIWKESPKPVYRWYGGFMERVLLGDKLDLSDD
jgi:hypothetical protein